MEWVVHFHPIQTMTVLDKKIGNVGHKLKIIVIVDPKLQQFGFDLVYFR